MLCPEFRCDSGHFALDETRLRKLAAVFVNRDSTNLAGPIVDISEEPPVKQAQVIEIKRSAESMPSQTQLTTKGSATFERS